MTCIRHSKLQCVECGRPQAEPAAEPDIPRNLPIGGPTMGKHINPTRTAGRGTAAYAAGEYLYKNGATPARQLFAAVEFGGTSTRPEEALQRAMAYGWLIEREGKIDISTYARGHFDKLAGIEPVQWVGQIAAVRTPPNIFTRPPLSKKYIPNPRGTRQDIPAWSVRSVGSIFYKA